MCAIKGPELLEESSPGGQGGQAWAEVQRHICRQKLACVIPMKFLGVKVAEPLCL